MHFIVILLLAWFVSLTSVKAQGAPTNTDRDVFSYVITSLLTNPPTPTTYIQSDSSGISVYNPGTPRSIDYKYYRYSAVTGTVEFTPLDFPSVIATSTAQRATIYQEILNRNFGDGAYTNTEITSDYIHNYFVSRRVTGTALLSDVSDWFLLQDIEPELLPYCVDGNTWSYPWEATVARVRKNSGSYGSLGNPENWSLSAPITSSNFVLVSTSGVVLVTGPLDMGGNVITNGASVEVTTLQGDLVEASTGVFYEVRLGNTTNILFDDGINLLRNGVLIAGRGAGFPLTNTVNADTNSVPGQFGITNLSLVQAQTGVYDQVTVDVLRIDTLGDDLYNDVVTGNINMNYGLSVDPGGTYAHGIQTGVDATNDIQVVNYRTMTNYIASMVQIDGVKVYASGTNLYLTDGSSFTNLITTTPL